MVRVPVTLFFSIIQIGANSILVCAVYAINNGMEAMAACHAAMSGTPVPLQEVVANVVEGKTLRAQNDPFWPTGPLTPAALLCINQRCIDAHWRPASDTPPVNTIVTALGDRRTHFVSKHDGRPAEPVLRMLATAEVAAQLPSSHPDILMLHVRPHGQSLQPLAVFGAAAYDMHGTGVFDRSPPCRNPTCWPHSCTARSRLLQSRAYTFKSFLRLKRPRYPPPLPVCISAARSLSAAVHQPFDADP